MGVPIGRRPVLRLSDPIPMLDREAFHGEEAGYCPSGRAQVESGGIEERVGEAVAAQVVQDHVGGRVLRIEPEIDCRQEVDGVGDRVLVVEPCERVAVGGPEDPEDVSILPPSVVDRLYSVTAGWPRRGAGVTAACSGSAWCDSAPVHRCILLGCWRARRFSAPLSPSLDGEVRGYTLHVPSRLLLALARPLRDQHLLGAAAPEWHPGNLGDIRRQLVIRPVAEQEAQPLLAGQRHHDYRPELRRRACGKAARVGCHQLGAIVRQWRSAAAKVALNPRLAQPRPREWISLRPAPKARRCRRAPKAGPPCARAVST